ncbi:MAG: type II secretion system protein [Phycisphaerales bacterium JB059]
MLRTRRDNPGSAQRQAFTLLELLVVIAIIATLISILLVGFGAARRAAKAAGDRQAVAGLGLAVTQFRSDNDFVPPLVYDGDPISMTTGRAPKATDDAGGEGPVFEVEPNRWVVSVWDAGKTEDLEVLRQRDDGGLIHGTTGQDAWADPRYSKYALAYYLAGSLPEEVDGVSGLGMFEPLASGGFRGVGAVIGRGRTTVEPYIATDTSSVNLAQSYVDKNEPREHGAAMEMSPGEIDSFTTDSEARFRTAVTDRNGVAYRYYRWEPGRYDSDQGQYVVERTADLNIPAALINPVLYREFLDDPETEIDLTEGDTRLRGATYAIVGAGEDGLFGTEHIEVILEALGRDGATLSAEGEAELRRQVQQDNVVEVGD